MIKDVRFIRYSIFEVQFAIFSYKPRIGGHSFSSITSDSLDFYITKTEQYLQTNVDMP